MNSDEKKLALVLVFLRFSLGVFLMCVTLEYFVDPVGALKVWNQLYPIQMTGSWVPIIGILLLVLCIFFILGAFRVISYAIVVMLQLITVVASFKSLISPSGMEMVDRVSFLYYASGIPLLAAFFALFLLRHYDLWSVDERIRHLKY
jgi:hypothetical protein